MHYVYVLQSQRYQKLYVGKTTDLKRRVLEHKNGKVWTTKRMLPVRLIFYEAFLKPQDAQRRERYLKTTKGRATLRIMLTNGL